MGMSIDETEAIEILKDIRLNANYMQNKESRTGMACELAVDTMRKYQEIRKIYMTHHYTDEEVIEKIKEVIKWG